MKNTYTTQYEKTLEIRRKTYILPSKGHKINEGNLRSNRKGRDDIFKENTAPQVSNQDVSTKTRTSHYSPNSKDNFSQKTFSTNEF